MIQESELKLSPLLSKGGSYLYKPGEDSPADQPDSAGKAEPGGGENPQSGKSNKNVIIGVLIGLVILGLGGFLLLGQGEESTPDNDQSQADTEGDKPEEYPLANTGEVSPISGLECENWARRPIAVMHPTDVSTRPLAGLSQADMVVEMPVLVDGKTRLMGVYVCGEPEEVGSIRSSRHDFISLAKGLDAIYVHWGGSQFAKEKLNNATIENMNCNNDGGKSADQCCFRKEGFTKYEDSGYAKFDQLLQCAEDFEYRLEGKFAGYPHQGEAPVEDRPNGGSLRVGFASNNSPIYVEFAYDQESNSYQRIWGGVPDKDRNNDKRLAPKNVVVLVTTQEKMVDDNGSLYNNVELGDPWYDEVETGKAFYYFNGQEKTGTWEKDNTSADSKLKFLDENGKEIKFVPGQIWVEILEPGRALEWTPFS